MIEYIVGAMIWFTCIAHVVTIIGMQRHLDRIVDELKQIRKVLRK